MRSLKPCPAGARAADCAWLAALGRGRALRSGRMCGPAPHSRERTAPYEPTCTSPVLAAGSWPPSSGSPLAVALPM